MRDGSRPKLLVVDIPIGLADRGVREADRLARVCLRGRACCVFNAPLRGMLRCTDYDAACDYGEQVEGKRISRQTWGIIPKIKEVDEALAETGHTRVKEGHPEVSFALMNGGEPLADRKSSSAGRAARLRLLERHFPGISGEVEKHGALRGDLIDALAMLWTARRIENGEAQALPESPLKDASGLLMQIWA